MLRDITKYMKALVVLVLMLSFMMTVIGILIGIPMVILIHLVH